MASAAHGMQMLGLRLEEAAASEMLVLHFRLHNVSTTPLFAWSTLSRMTYDDRTQELTVEASVGDKVRRHPRIPRQVRVDAGGDAEVELSIPKSWRGVSLGTGLTSGLRTRTIGPVRRVHYSISYGPDDYSRAHGTNQNIHAVLAVNNGLLQGDVELSH